MNYAQNTITIVDLQMRIADLAAAGRDIAPSQDEPKETFAHIEWCNAHDEHEELKKLREVEQALSWCWGSDTRLLVNEDYFTQHCEKYCYDAGLCQPDSVVAVCCDWEKVADRMRSDYQEVNLPDGQTFLVRGPGC